MIMPGIATLTEASATPCRIRASAEIMKNISAVFAKEARPKVRVASDIINMPETTQVFRPIFSICVPMKGAVTKKAIG